MWFIQYKKITESDRGRIDTQYGWEISGEPPSSWMLNQKTSDFNERTSECIFYTYVIVFAVKES